MKYTHKNTWGKEENIVANISNADSLPISISYDSCVT